MPVAPLQHVLAAHVEPAGQSLVEVQPRCTLAHWMSWGTQTPLPVLAVSVVRKQMQVPVAEQGSSHIVGLSQGTKLRHSPGPRQVPPLQVWPLTHCGGGWLVGWLGWLGGTWLCDVVGLYRCCLCSFCFPTERGMGRKEEGKQRGDFRGETKANEVGSRTTDFVTTRSAILYVCAHVRLSCRASSLG